MLSHYHRVPLRLLSPEMWVNRTRGSVRCPLSLCSAPGPPATSSSRDTAEFCSDTVPAGGVASDLSMEQKQQDPQPQACAGLVMASRQLIP
jgi:hypothetical protein